MSLFKKKKQLDMSRLPEHIAFIMDGNRRWARMRGLPDSMGHREGSLALKRVCEACRDLGVRTITVYALSTENLKRSDKELNAIFNLVTEFLSSEIDSAQKQGVRINILGDLAHERIPEDTRQACLNAIEKTKDNDKYILNIAFLYGGRADIVRAVNNLLQSGVKSVDEQTFSSFLYTSGQPDPDLVVRSSGEMRVSNFLLWQMAYSELVFTKKLWPDFNKSLVSECIIEYQGRKRNFGGNAK